jgi:hypothetical protein
MGLCRRGSPLKAVVLVATLLGVAYATLSLAVALGHASMESSSQETFVQRNGPKAPQGQALIEVAEVDKVVLGSMQSFLEQWNARFSAIADRFQKPKEEALPAGDLRRLAQQRQKFEQVLQRASEWAKTQSNKTTDNASFKSSLQLLRKMERLSKLQAGAGTLRGIIAAAGRKCVAATTLGAPVRLFDCDGTTAQVA